MDEITESLIPTVELGGRLWELRFGHKAMRMFCKTAKCSLTNFEQTQEDYDNQILLLWCILQVQDSSVKREELDDWLDKLLLEDVFKLVQDAIAAAMPSTAGKRVEAFRKGLGEENPTMETSSETA